MTLTGSVNAATYTDNSGNYSFTVPVGSVYAVTPSRASLPPASPAINIVDVAVTTQYYLTGGSGIIKCPLAADVNLDARVNSMDVVAIQRFSLGYSSWSCGRYVFTPITPTMDFTAMLVGDVM